MLKIILTAFLTTSKLLRNVVDKDRVNGKFDDEKKNLPIFSVLQRLTGADYLIFDAKKTFNLL